MFYRQQSNQYINEGTQFTIDGVTYPSSWLNQSTPEQKTELGLEEVITINNPEDGEYYWVTEVLESPTKSYTNTPKDLDMVKQTSINKIKSMVYTTLVGTDYIEMRNMKDPTYKPDWVEWRDFVRTYSNTVTTSINAATTVDEIKIIMTSVQFPLNPDN
jgi:hypothetical protein